MTGPDEVTPTTPLQGLRGIGPARARSLAEAGYRTVSDLLLHLPLRYEDRSRVHRLGDLSEEGSFTFVARLRGLADVRARRRGLAMVRGWAEDDSGSVRVVWFNRPYLRRQVEEGAAYLLHGRVQRHGGGFQLVNPTCEAVDHAVHGGRIVPIYPSIGKLGPVALRHVLDQILASVTAESFGEDPLPESLRRRYGMPRLGEALLSLHRPEESDDIERLNARRSAAHLRLIYGELFRLQIQLALVRSEEVRRPKEHSYRIDDPLREVVRDVLPFKLTGAQKRVLKEIADDLQSPYPMLRLLQGDVGSGKTIVAALSLVLAMENGLQGAFMAPTELLAEQQYRSLRRLLADRFEVALLTGSHRTAEPAALADGSVQLAVGTHALIQEGVRFRALGLAVIDEQHRFGVGQRELLQRKGDRPDVLVMTATPIPRSLALTVYGDLAVSILDELPPGRTPIRTRVVDESSRATVYRWLRRRIEGGDQAYVVFPLIEESEQLSARSIEASGRDVARRLGSQRTAVVHGRMAAEEREERLRAFAEGDLQVLIATTVIEVGIDVPNATIMVIESAERFGLAQLHQLRGRVGRGRRASACVALHGALTEDAERRLQVFGETTDGFRIAEADLEIRGPGDLLGTRQAGLPTFRVANIVTDREWVERAREDAHRILVEAPRSEVEPLLARLGARALSRYDRFAGG
ncbi:MAG: ATP-dependent DNA helicase RecG [Thermoanaerobaculia bacterium]